MRIVTPVSVELSALCALVACAAAPAVPAPVPASAPEPTAGAPAFRYLVAVVFERGWSDIAEVYLPDQGLACNVSSSFVPKATDPFASEFVARAFFAKAPRNRDRNNHERPTERYLIPADLAADMLELARLTARQHELAVRVGTRIVPIVPLDEQYEFERLLDELTHARTLAIDQKQVDLLEQRKERIREGSITDNREQLLRDIRNELAALVRQAR